LGSAASVSNEIKAYGKVPSAGDVPSIPKQNERDRLWMGNELPVNVQL